MVNKVNAKYSIKNNITDAAAVFLVIKNQIRAIDNSRTNFKITDTMVCIV
jgi:2-C-methyl-D-erythritol 4-phosphate cytidylyltransferase